MLKKINLLTFAVRLLLVFVFAGFFTQLINAGELNGIRFWKDPEKTRAVFDLTDKIEYKLFTLDNPYRLVVDIKNTQLKVDLTQLELAEDLVKQIRSSQQNNQLRIVMDLKNGVTTKDFTLKPFQDYGHRLVVDLRDKNSKKQVIKTATTSNGMRDIIIAIDAGHGGEDPGAIGLRKTREKDITLSVAKKLYKKINDEKGMKAILTRTGDYYVSLRDRTDLARRHRADLFISLHADAFTDRRVKGAGVWVLSPKGASSEIGRWLEQGEKNSDLAGGVALSNRDPLLAEVLLDLSMHYSVGASMNAAINVHKSLSRKLPKMHSKSIQRAAFVVLKMPDIPAILVEMAFISNPDDERALKTSKMQNTITYSLLDGVKKFFKDNPPDGTFYAMRAKSKTYVVKSGDTLSHIALRFDVPMQRILTVNKLKSSQLKIGQVLTIPGE